MIFQMQSTRILAVFCCSFFISPCFAEVAKTSKDLQLVDKSQNLDNLVEKANDFIVKRQFQKAEPILDRALKLTESRVDATVIDKLVQVYCAEKKWSEAEKLLETKGRAVWNSEAVDLRVAEILSNSGQNAEAYVILRRFVPEKISASAGSNSKLLSCGDETEDARKIRKLFFTAGYKSLALSEAELKQIETNRQQKIQRWKTEIKS